MYFFHVLRRRSLTTLLRTFLVFTRVLAPWLGLCLPSRQSMQEKLVEEEVARRLAIEVETRVQAELAKRLEQHIQTMFAEELARRRGDIEREIQDRLAATREDLEQKVLAKFEADRLRKLEEERLEKVGVALWVCYADLVSWSCVHPVRVSFVIHVTGARGAGARKFGANSVGESKKNRGGSKAGGGL